MKKISHFSAMRIWDDLSQDSKIFQGGVVTLGNFDGLHLGHQALIKAVAAEPGPRVVMTFHPHPVTVLRPEVPFKRLLPAADLAEVLPQYPIDLLLRIPFTLSLAKLSPEEFFEQKILKPFRPTVVVAGYDFALGNERRGDLKWLEAFAKEKGLRVRHVPAVMDGGSPISSRRLREVIERGDVQTAEKWLGRAFYIRGSVVKGAGRGRGLGLPTLNIPIQGETAPAPGVYVTRTKWRDQLFPSVTNIGTAPTFSGATEPRIETHILDQTLDLYGQTVDVRFHRRLRDEMKFSDVESLKKQIERDILEARREFRQE